MALTKKDLSSAFSLMSVIMAGTMLVTVTHRVVDRIMDWSLNEESRKRTK